MRCFLAGGFVGILMVFVPGSVLVAEELQPTTDAKETVHASGSALQARCADGSVLRLMVLDEIIPLMTDYGTINVPVAAIARIEFASRLPAVMEARVRKSVEQLGSDQFDVREAATANLSSLEDAALPALVIASDHQDREVRERVERLIDALRQTLPEERLEVRNYDTIVTDKSQIAGMIQLTELQVSTLPFGRQKLQLDVLRQLARLDAVETPPVNALADPGTLMNLQGEAGKTLHFRITGNGNGFVWGTDTYTLDSNLSAAAIHAGVCKPGETKVVSVTILGAAKWVRWFGSQRSDDAPVEFLPGGVSVRSAAATVAVRTPS